MSNETLLAISLTRANPPLVEQVSSAVAAGAQLIELRVDCIRDHAAVDNLLKQPHGIPYIVTARRAAEGGSWDADETSRIALLVRLARHQPGFVDVEHTVWRGSADVRRRIGSLCGVSDRGETIPVDKNTLILSHHDSHGTPDKLDDVFDELEASPAGVVKAVFTANDTLDSLRVLEQLHRRGARRQMIALAMGEAGLPTRVLARKLGAFLTFVAPERGAESAPGQPTIAELRGVYRWDTIDGATPVFGVVGWPVTHSLSPRLHDAGLAAEGIAGVYLPLPVRPTYEDLAAFLDCATDAGWLDLAGLSVTIPHKEHVARWLDQRGHAVGAFARSCGAVNTLARTSDSGWRGENTDASGALRALQTVPELAGDGLRGKMVDVLGAGGVARAVVAALVEHGCEVTIYNRSRDRAQRLAHELRCRWTPWRQRWAGDGAVLINCTSIGMTPDVQSAPVPAQRLRPDTVIFDTVYTPAETTLLREARARGCRVVSGIELFVAQAADQFALWHGRPAPLEAMRRALFRPHSD